MSEISRWCGAPTSTVCAECIFSQASEGGTWLCGFPDGQQIEKSGPEAAPASRSLRRESKKARQTRAISGLISSGSSKNADLGPALANRLAARMAAFGSPEYTLTWNLSGMSFQRPQTEVTSLLTFRLRASARRTSDKDFTGWPTPQGNKNTESGPLTDKDGAPWDGRRKPYQNGKQVTTALSDAVQLVGWATATTRDGKADGKDGENRVGSPSLPAMALVAITGLFRVPTGRRAVLAPEFSLWLMGFPEAWVSAAPGAKDWREAQAALEWECSKDLETQSSQNSQPNS